MTERAEREHLSPAAAGRQLGYSDWKVRRMCEAGRFPNAYRDGPGSHWRIPTADIEAFRRAQQPRVVRRQRTA